MLRVETQKSDGALICKLQGRFTAEGAEDVRLLVARCNSQLDLVVDLTDLMFIDTVGEDVLCFVKKLGAQFIAETSYARDVCERLQLPLCTQMSSNGRENGNGFGR